MVRVMIRHLHSLAQQRLSFAMRQWREEVRFRIGYQFPHGRQVVLKRLHALLPRRRVLRLRALRPISGRPGGRNVFCIAAELEHVPLGDTQVLQQIPGRVRSAFRSHAAQLRGKIGHRRLEIGMCALAGQQTVEFFPK